MSACYRHNYPTKIHDEIVLDFSRDAKSDRNYTQWGMLFQTGFPNSWAVADQNNAPTDLNNLMHGGSGRAAALIMNMMKT